MNQFFCILLFVLAAGAHAAGQANYVTTKNASSKLLKLHGKARYLASLGQLEQAAGELNKALVQEPRFVDALIERGNVYNQMGRLDAAESDYKAALRIDSTYDLTLWYSLAIVELDQEKFDHASEHFEVYLKRATEGSSRAAKARQYLANASFAAKAIANPVPFIPQNLGPTINTAESEYLPVLTADGQQLIYTALRAGQEDFYRSEWKSDSSQWQVGVPISAVNSPYNEGAQTISADGKLLIFTICNRPGGRGSCDLYFTEFRNNAWSSVKNLGHPVNTAAYESLPSVSADGNTLYFTSDRKGGYGGLDIWVSHRGINGQWSAPKNLGPVINTADHEQAPFIHADGSTLYFMSKGHSGMGKYDLFFSRSNPEGTWSEPQNLGYPINTKDNEGALTISLDGRTAYFASDMPGGYGKTDIYSFELYEAARPMRVTYVKAKTFDAATGEPLVARVEMYDLGTGHLTSLKITDTDGVFLSVLPSGKNYALNVSAPGYLFHSENFALDDSLQLDDPFLLEIPLQPISYDSLSSPSAIPVVLRNVFFETGSSTLLPESTLELDKLKALLETYSQLRIQINGHTDDVGSEADNLKLSTARAKAVYDYLVGSGVSAERLQYKGFGEDVPIESNTTADGRKRNRRTEFQLVK